MFKIGMFNKEVWKLDFITKAMSKIPTSHTIITFAFAMIGAFLVIGGFFAGANRIDTDIENIPEYVFLIIVGWMLFSLFLPIPYIVYLFKEMQLLKDRAKPESNMFKKIFTNHVETAEGFSVEILGREGIKYQDSSNIYQIHSEIIVDSPMNFRAAPLPGSCGMVIYKNHIRYFESQIGSSDSIDEEIINEIVENIRKAFEFWGYKFEVEESY